MISWSWENAIECSSVGGKTCSWNFAYSGTPSSIGAKGLFPKHRAAIDVNHLARNKVALVRSQEDRCSHQVLGHFGPLDDPIRDYPLSNVVGEIVAGLALRVAGRDRVDADAGAAAHFVGKRPRQT